MTNGQKKSLLMRQMRVGAAEIEILGSVVWWNVHMVDVSRAQVCSFLEQNQFDKKYAREHNYRSAFVRAIRQMEEQRIIRRVEEDSKQMIYQFTTETKVSGNGTGNPELRYDPETIIVINKDMCRAGNFEAAIVQCSDEIKQQVVEFYQQEKERYRSSDISRCVKRLFRDYADIVSLREQGNVYFVPAGYTNIVERTVSFLAQVGGCVLEHLPVPNVPSGRQMVARAFANEIDGLQEALDKEIDEVQSGNKEVSERWYSHRLKQIDKIKKRIGLYADVLDDKVQELTGGFDALVKKIRAPRKLDLGN